jgi:hypothetical protein
VNYLGTWTAAWNKFDFRWRTDCSGGALIQKGQFGDLHLVEFQPELGLTGERFKEEAETLLPLSVDTAQAFIDDTRLMLTRFVAALDHQEPVETSGKDHLKSLSLIFACIEAARTGRRVEMQGFYHRHGIPDEWLQVR